MTMLHAVHSLDLPHPCARVQGIRFIFSDGSRVVYRLSGTGSSLFKGQTVSRLTWFWIAV